MSEDIETRGHDVIFVGSINAKVKTIRLPPEHGGDIVDVVSIHRHLSYVYYQLDNESPNLVIDTGIDFLWGNGVWKEEE